MAGECKATGGECETMGGECETMGGECETMGECKTMGESGMMVRVRQWVVGETMGEIAGESSSRY